MVKHRFFISLLSTIVLYALMGLLFFYVLSKTIGTEQKPKEKTISFSLSEYTPEVTPPVEEIIEEPVVKEEPIVEELEPPVIEEVIPEPIVEKTMPKPQPIIKKKIIKKPVPKKKKIKKKKVSKKKHKKRVKKRVSQKKAHKKTSRKKVSSQHHASPAQKNRFLNQLRAKINRYKTYPRIAQRRGMQGVVKVRFTILKNGQVANISVTGASVFRKSARNAVQKSFPINVKNAPLSLPKTVNITLRYQIR